VELELIPANYKQLLAEYKARRAAEPSAWPMEFDRYRALTPKEQGKFRAYLAREAPLWQISEYLGYFTSFERSWVLSLLLLNMEAPRFWRVFFKNWSSCDHPWRDQGFLLPMLRHFRAEINPIEFFGNAERTWFEAQPDPLVVHRGSNRGHTRGISWTADEAVARIFARGDRFPNTDPVIAHAEIPKAAVFGVIFGRKESEVILDPRRLRKLRVEPVSRRELR
jgi:hypothetical protein